MFEQSLVEMPREMRRRKRWMTFASFMLESAAVLALLAFPLLHTEALPLDEHPTVHPPTRYSPPHVDIIDAAPQPRASRTAAVMINPYLAPQRIPAHIDMNPDPVGSSAIPAPPCVGCIPVSGGDDRGIRDALESSLHNAPPLPPRRPTAPVARTSRAQESLLIYQVKPSYPHIAQMTHTQGTVLLRAMISREGRIESLQVVSGPPLLVNAALDAVRQWRYRPFFLNGDPVPVETQVTVHFTLGGQ